ncbi:MAG: hypothetical protein AAGC65_13085 [Mucilaginibacter sp.]|uniref:hypothetical protein n=1 Tax=Mucilaginibacter sp. TaxID=1882438 RepID=UPI0031ACF645
MKKVYDILLNKIRIGTTKLENADVPMGVVFGQIDFVDTTSKYTFFRNYCLENKIDFEDYPRDKLISTSIIPHLTVYEASGYMIKGEGCFISGMDETKFDIYIHGITDLLYREEFPHRIKTK